MESNILETIALVKAWAVTFVTAQEQLKAVDQELKELEILKAQKLEERQAIANRLKETDNRVEQGVRMLWRLLYR